MAQQWNTNESYLTSLNETYLALNYPVKSRGVSSDILCKTEHDNCSIIQQNFKKSVDKLHFAGLGKLCISQNTCVSLP